MAIPSWLEDWQEWPVIAHYIRSPIACSLILLPVLLLFWTIFWGAEMKQEADWAPPERELFAERLSSVFDRPADYFLEDDKIKSGRETNCDGYSGKEHDDCALHAFLAGGEAKPIFFLCPRPPGSEINCELIRDADHGIAYLAKSLGLLRDRS